MLASKSLVFRFAVASLVVFVAVGGAVAYLTEQRVRGRHEEFAESHARFLTSVLQQGLRPRDLIAPATGARYRRLRALVHRRIVPAEVLWVTVWRPDGTIVFSDQPSLVGRRLPREGEWIRRVLREGPVSEVADRTPTAVPTRSCPRRSSGRLCP